MIPEKIGFIGLGHIGGSVAKTVHRIYPDIQIVAYDTCRATLDTALQEGVISEALDQVGKGFSDCNYIYLCARFSTMQTMSGNYPAFCMMICF